MSDLHLRDVLDEVIASVAAPEAAERMRADAATARQASTGTVIADPYLVAIAEAIAGALSLSLPDAYRLIGQRAMPTLEPLLRADLRRHTTALTFCLHMHGVVDGALQALVPDAKLPSVDVEMINASRLRISLPASDEGVGLLQGLLMGLARHYGQQARFAPTPSNQIPPGAVFQGRRFQDVSFSEDSRGPFRAAPLIGQERRHVAPAVATRDNSR